MSQSNEAGHYFQTSDSLATEKRKAAKAKNKHGNPIKLPSKVLAVCRDENDDGAVYIAEAAGELKRVVLESGKTRKLFSQGMAPLTCLATCPRSKSLFTGCWDKNIYVIPLKGNESVQRLSGHTDFVKCLLVTSLNGKPVLISGAADATIIIWDVNSRQQLHKLKGHTKSLQDLAIDPQTIADSAREPQDSFVLFTASSDPEIRRWHIHEDSAQELAESIENPLLAHDTSVYKICFDSDGDLWTASADKTAKHLVRTRNWESDTVLEHPDFVRDIVVVERLGLVVTACRDEEVRVWDSASGNLICTYSGHYEEVTGLVVQDSVVVSVSIDGTIRRWALGRQDMARYLEELKKESELEESDAGAGKGGSVLTAEEEAELAELMDDDD